MACCVLNFLLPSVKELGSLARPRSASMRYMISGFRLKGSRLPGSCSGRWQYPPSRWACRSWMVPSTVLQCGQLNCPSSSISGILLRKGGLQLRVGQLRSIGYSTGFTVYLVSVLPSPVRITRIVSGALRSSWSRSRYSGLVLLTVHAYSWSSPGFFTVNCFLSLPSLGLSVGILSRSTSFDSPTGIDPR
jgi:hypothetical protein